MKIRAHLDLLALGAIAPVLIASVVASVLLAAHEQTTFKREAIGRARSAMSAVDVELGGSIGTMQALAASKNLEKGDIRAFHEEARRVLATQRPAWRNIGLASVAREQLMDATLPFGRHAAFGAGDASFDRAIRTGKPVIGDITPGPAVSAPSLRLRVPVIVGDSVRYVLSVPLDPASLEEILAAQQLPAGWTIGLVDRGNKFIARLPSVPVGTSVSSDFRAAIEKAREGWFSDRTLEGAETYMPYVTSAISGWVLGISIPAPLVEGGAWRTFWLTFFGVLLALAAALLLAYFMARRITGPIVELVGAAESLQTGRDVALPTTRGIDEISHLHDVLFVASIATQDREAMLRREREALREQAQMLDLARDAIMMRSAAGVIKFWSDGAENMFGWSKTEAIGRKLSELLHTQFPSSYHDIEAELERTGHWDGVLRHTRKDGAHIMVASRWALHRARTDQSGIVLEIATDITRQLEAERSIALLNDELIEADKRKDHFLATLAHELRNPLAPISNCVTMLKSASMSPDELRWARDVIERQLAQMARLLDDLLDISRITHGKLVLRRAQVALAEVVETAVETCRPLVESGSHELIVDAGPAATIVNVDAVRLAQILANLLNNAAKYSNRGTRIWLTVETWKENLNIEVRDEGIGISAEMLPRVFDIFAQASDAESRAKGGMGIGLALVRALASLHGGSVEAHSPGPGAGSRFVVRLPQVVVQTAAAGGAARKTSGMAPTSILLADDLNDSADSLAMLLRDGGHTVHVAYDGAHAFEIAARSRPRVAVLDIGMPKLTGYEVARKIRAQPWGRDMLLVALSGWGQFEDRRRSREAGFDHHLVKPLALDELNDVLATALHRIERAAQF